MAGAGAVPVDPVSLACAVSTCPDLDTAPLRRVSDAVSECWVGVVSMLAPRLQKGEAFWTVSAIWIATTVPPPRSVAAFLRFRRSPIPLFWSSPGLVCPSSRPQKGAGFFDASSLGQLSSIARILMVTTSCVQRTRSDCRFAPRGRAVSSSPVCPSSAEIALSVASSVPSCLPPVR